MKINLSEAECLNILGVSAGATADEIKQRYHFLRKIHPDKFTSAQEKAHADDLFKRYREAYERLIEIRQQKPADAPATEDNQTDTPPPEKSLPGGSARWRWNDPWRFWKKSGPPPRCSPDTIKQWPLLRSVHQWWLRPCAIDAEAKEKEQPPKPPKDCKLYIEDSDKLPVAATLFVKKAQQKGLAGQLYWAAETEQTAKVCYLRFLKPILGDVCVNVEAVLAKQMNLTYVELTLGTVLWWRPDKALRRLRLRSLAVLVWLGFSALAQMTLPNGTGAGAISLAVAGLFVLAWVAHWDFRVDYGKVDWKCLYPFALWRSRFEIPLVIQVVCFFAWRQWGVISGNDPGARAVYLPVLIWLIGHCLWKTAWPVDYPEQSLGERPPPKDVDAYLAAVNSLFSGK